MIAYSIIITVLLIATGALVIFQYKNRPRGNTAEQIKKIIELSNKIKLLENKNNVLEQTREKLENESKQNFNTDTGHAVTSDLAD